MAEVIWTTRAWADIEAIADYLALSAPSYAETMVRRLLASSERLEVFPLSGRIVPEIDQEDIREVILRNYRIVYLFDKEKDRVEILTVFHSSRQLGKPPGTG